MQHPGPGQTGPGFFHVKPAKMGQFVNDTRFPQAVFAGEDRYFLGNSLTPPMPLKWASCVQSVASNA